MCSPYKFFGPHLGVMFGRRELLSSSRLLATGARALVPDRIRTATDALPDGANSHMSRWEPGTQSFEALAGARAAVDYLAGLGQRPTTGAIC